MTVSKVFAQANLSPTVVTAGDSYEFIITLAVGEGYTRGPSRIVFDFAATLGISRSTSAIPTSRIPSATGTWS